MTTRQKKVEKGKEEEKGKKEKEVFLELRSYSMSNDMTQDILLFCLEGSLNQVSKKGSLNQVSQFCFEGSLNQVSIKCCYSD